jgi:diguanylate cyclase (GGDEF)-like protein
MAHLTKKLFDFFRVFTKTGLNVSANDSRLRADYYDSNLPFGITSGVLLCIISFIGLVGTYSPFSDGQVLKGLNATAVYLIIFATNLFFVLLLYRELRLYQGIVENRMRYIYLWFMNVNMVMASLTFYTTQRGSSFFFEYILVTITVLIVPNTKPRVFVRNVIVNAISMSVVLASVHHTLAWQDIVDILAFYIICGFVNWVRWLSFLRMEDDKFQTEKKKDEFYRESRTDALTGLLNRAGLRDDFPVFLDRQVGAALIDLDSFKQCNDTYGHAYGDEVLKLTGRRMKLIFDAAADRCYRYGGDEFLILSEEGDAPKFYRKLSDLRKLFESEHNGMRTPCSIGFCIGTARSDEELRVLIGIADNYLYQAKSESKDRMKGTLSPVNMENLQSSEQNSVLERMKDTDDAAALFEQNHMAGKSWNIAYLNVNRFAEGNEESGYREELSILEKIGAIILHYFPDALLVNREVDHFVLLSEIPENEFINRIRSVQDEVFNLGASRMIILRVGIFRHLPQDPPMKFITGMLHAKYASDAASDSSRGDKYLCIYDADMDLKRTKELFVHNNFLTAVESGCLVPYYQPIVGSLSGATCGFEALSRWIDPEKGVIPPDDFVPYLEKTGEVYRLDLCILEQVCRDIRDHRDLFSERIFVNVNLSQTDFQFANMTDEIYRIVSKYGVASRQIQLEITESAFTDSQILRDALNKLKGQGFRIWMDDFGVGEASLSALRNNKIEGIKLDQSFFADIKNHRTQIIIRSVIELSHEANCMMIAEGIENRNQLRCAQQWGVNFIQGFICSRPLPLEKLLKSSFVKNLTDEGTDRYYQATAEANLAVAYKSDFYLQNGKTAVFATAVLESGQKLHILRMNDPMQELLGDFVRTEDEKYILDENSGIASILRDAMEMVRSEQRAVDFAVDIRQDKLYGQLAFLAENTTCGKIAFMLHLSDFYPDVTQKLKRER